MKTNPKNRNLTVLLALAIIFLATSCKKNTDDNPDPGTKTFTDLKVAEDFTWTTSMNLKIALEFFDKNQNPVETEFTIWTEYPEGKILIEGVSRNNGKFSRKYTVTTSRQSITVVVPGNEPEIINFTPTVINKWPAYEASKTIVLDNPPLKSGRNETYAFFPSEGQFGTLCFEDNWPNKGDYDFNDMVIDYNVKATYNDDDLVTQIEMQLYLRAAGASNDNSFGISFRFPWSYQGPYPDIASVIVNGQPVNAENTNYPSYILIPSTKAVMPVYNTFMNNPFDNPVEFVVLITFENPIDEWDLELPLQNSFITINQDRGREVHLPFNPPTSLADPNLFGTGNDATDPEVLNPDNFKVVFGYFTYMTQDWYPWALNIYFENGSNELFYYSTERTPIIDAYSSFAGWVENWDPWEWYLPQYRINDKVYSKIPEPPYGDQ